MGNPIGDTALSTWWGQSNPSQAFLPLPKLAAQTAGGMTGPHGSLKQMGGGRGLNSPPLHFSMSMELLHRVTKLGYACWSRLGTAAHGSASPTLD